jgi:superfamily II DNA/RNA helicase
MMFSATFNKNCRELARKYLANDHVRIRIGRAGSAHENVQQQVSSEIETFSRFITDGNRLSFLKRT